MKAFVHSQTNYSIQTIPKPSCGEGEVLLRMQAAGLNRRDLYIKERRGMNNQPLVLGSDGVGIIEEVGPNVSKWKIGDQVIINPALRWFEQSIIPPNDFDILGMPDNGTMAEYLVISSEQIEPALPELTIEENASIALAGMTGYRALITKGQLEKNQTVFIAGGSSGVATFMIQIAKAIGAEVITTSRSKKKREQLSQLGADCVLHTEEDWKQALSEKKVDLVIDSIGGEIFSKALAVLKPGGRLVSFGATTEDEVQLNVRNFFYAQQQIIGSTMGCREELRDLLSLLQKYNIQPVIDSIYALEEASQAFQTLEKSQQFGKIVLSMN